MLTVASSDSSLGPGFYVATLFLTLLVVWVAFIYRRPSARRAYKQRLADDYGESPQGWWPYSAALWRAWQRTRWLGIGILATLLPTMWLLSLGEILDAGWLMTLGALCLLVVVVLIVL